MSSSCPVESQPLSRRRAMRTLALILVLGLGLRLLHLDYRGLWTDELTTLETTRMAAGEVVAERMSRGHFPTYFLVVNAWARIFGESEWALRLPSALMGTAAILFIWATARRGWGERAGLLCALLFAVHERALWASQEARPYALAMLAGAGALHALCLGLEARKRGAWAAYVWWSLLGLFSSPAFGFVFLFQTVVVGVWLLRVRKWRGDWAVCALLGLCLGIYGLVYLGQTQQNTGFYSTRAWPSLRMWTEAVTQVFWGNYDTVFGSSFRHAGLMLAAAVVAIAWGGRRGLAMGARVQWDTMAGGHPNANDRPSPHPSLKGRGGLEDAPPLFALACAWALGVIAGMGVSSGLFKDMTGSFRYYAIGVGGASLLQGAALASFSCCRRRSVFLGLIVALLTAISIGFLYSPGEQAREAVREVAENRKEGEPILICNDSHAETLAGYYGLGVKPIAISNRILERGALILALESGVGRVDGFWVIYYKEKGSPLESVVREWTEDRFDRERTSVFREARVDHYQRQILAAGN